MQNEGAIRQKLKQVRFRHQKRLIQAHLDQRPCNCQWNREMTGPGDTVGSCLYSILNSGSPVGPVYQVCDERVDGGDLARDCSAFRAKRSKEGVKTEFDSFLRTATLGKIAETYPDMAALMWCLVGSADEGTNTEPQAELPVPPPPQEMSQKFWLRRLWEGVFS